MGKHTPGPWVAHDGTQHGGRRWGCWDVFADDKPGTYVAGVNRDNPDDEANARLIAAAPELLKAAERAERMLAEVTPANSYAGSPLAELRTAIAKATGESHG